MSTINSPHSNQLVIESAGCFGANTSPADATHVVSDRRSRVHLVHGRDRRSRTTGHVARYNGRSRLTSRNVRKSLSCES